ncbi:protein required for attachment to host cells [bacterium BMS3Abin07]|nr:protein required for attachment to host cells [bacterium BMS3Abin07]GBE32460.1 protein required for attachment to host cells [bacterium BMS3Bbin05]
MDKIIIVADSGYFRAYRIFKNPMESARIEIIKEFDNPEAHGKLGEILSDSAGKFGLGGGKTGVKGYGEPHNLELENKKRAIKVLAKNINKLIAGSACKKWYMAAGKKINRQILEYLDPAVKAKLSRNIPSDLTNAGKSEILARFEEA